MDKTFQITITGQVQGVGFRPYVYGLATSYNLKGNVSNDSQGVVIKVLGTETTIHKFYHQLINSPPPVSIIEGHRIEEIPIEKFNDFSIRTSTKQGPVHLRLTPDFAICEACKQDILNPKNERYGYPFTTCVHCGPRWAITKQFPFDRDTTHMDAFTMCPSCKHEYSDPTNRRFHSQTNSCPNCGVRISLLNANKQLLATNTEEVLEQVAKLLLAGHIVAIKNTSGYLLCCHAENPEAVQRLRDRKKRPTKPFAVLYPSLEKLEQELAVSPQQTATFNSTERPIVLLPLMGYRGELALEQIAPGLNHLGVMLPYTSILQLISNRVATPMVATSGNIHGSPVISDVDDSFAKLNTVADYFVQHDLQIEHAQDDSVLKFSSKFKRPILFRRSRGYAPNIMINIPKTNETVLAMGADMKNTLAILPNEYLYVSQYIGNLEKFDVYERFVSETESLINIFETKPEIVLIDKHPRYFSAAFGKEIAKDHDSKTVAIQHHKAHFAAVLGEHDLFQSTDKILGVIWDGVGYGEDDQVWGGEFFTYYQGIINRCAHFEYFDWLAGDKMSKEPRIALFSLCNQKEILASKFTNEELRIYQSLQKYNSLKTSSVGRLFDAVASLLGICDYNSYEGEASILLENCIDDYALSDCKSYCPEIFNTFIPTQSIIENIIADLDAAVPKQQIATNFIYTLAGIILRYANANGYTKIACSGGVFQNTILIDMLCELKDDTVSVYFNEQLSPNDESISFGQMMYYINCKEA